MVETLAGVLGSSALMAEGKALTNVWALVHHLESGQVSSPLGSVGMMS